MYNIVLVAFSVLFALELYAYVSNADYKIISLLAKNEVIRYRLILICYSSFMILLGLFNLYTNYVLYKARQGVTVDEETYRRH